LRIAQVMRCRLLLKCHICRRLPRINTICKGRMSLRNLMQRYILLAWRHLRQTITLTNFSIKDCKVGRVDTVI